MNWVMISQVVSFGVAILLLLRGIAVLVRSKSSPHIRSFGVLTIFLAGLGIIGQTLSFSHLFVFSPEFRAIMLQGPLARLGLSIIILAVAVASAFGWHLARSVVGCTSRSPWLLSAGLVVGLLSASRLQPLNPDNLEPLLIIYSYDLWWPPLPIWLSLCLVGIYSTLLQFKNRLVPVWTFTFIVIGLGVLALRQPTPSEFSSQGYWLVCILIAIPTNMILSAWITVRWLRAKFRSFGRWTKLDWALLSIGVGCLGSLLFIGGTPSSDDQTIAPTMFNSGASWFWLGWLVLVVGLAGSHRLYCIRRGGRLEWPSMSKPFVRRSIFLLVLSFIVPSLIGLFCFAGLNPSIALTIFFMFWILLCELISSGVLSRFRQSWRQGRLFPDELPLGRHWKAAWEKTRGVGSQLSGWLKGLTNIPSLPVAVVKVLVGIALLIALAEIPNAGKTMIQPFTTFGFSDQDTYSQLLAEQLFNNLGLFVQQLQPAIIIPSPGVQSGKAKIKTEVLSTALDSVDTMLDRSNDLEIGGVRIPLEVFVLPIRNPMREMLGVNIINGSVQLDQNKYIAHAYSNQGAIWVAEFSGAPARSRGEVSSKTVETTHIDAVTRLAEELAFKIVSHDPTLAAMGMTDSWDAFRSFQDGLESMQRFDNNDDYDALAEALQRFREAIEEDIEFALAYYHLGLALQSDGQPAAATEALRSSLTANPEFVTGYNTLAYHLYYFDNYYLSPGVLPKPDPAEESIQSRTSEARDLWRNIILMPKDAVSVPDRASAYYGLCLDALDSDMSLHAYFYCKLSERLYGELPVPLRSDPRIKQAEASVLNTTGVVLNKSLQDASYDFPENVWCCYGTNAGVYSAYGSAALQHYQRALALQPDDPILRCNAACTASALDQPQPMQELEMDSEAHLRLAGDYLESGYLELAFEEYQKAIERNPDNIWALNGYAYTFWTWRYSMPETEPPEVPDTDKTPADLAEEYAHRAVDLVAGNPSSLNEAIVRSTLGEVLLGTGHPREAIQELHYIIEENLIPDHPIANEIRWDLVRAYHEVGEVEQAFPYLVQIQQSECGREYQPFTDWFRSAELDLVLPACPRGTTLSTEPTS